MRYALAAFCLVATTTAAGAQAVTTRIETRPYYGAITTIEHGVRVTRSLPPHDRIIINPNGATPLSLNIGGGEAGNTVVQNSTSQTTVNGPHAGSFLGVPGYGGPRPVMQRPAMQQPGMPRPHQGHRTVSPTQAAPNHVSPKP
jgi:hypothetical protein